MTNNTLHEHRESLDLDEWDASAPSAQPAHLDRARLAEEHLWLAEQLARQMARRFPSHVERSELHAAALLGLAEAAERFDPTFGVPFPAYASVRIRGEILQVARSVDMAPRRLRRDLRVTAEVTERLTHRLGRHPNDTEVASALDIGVEVVRQRWAHAHTTSLTSLDRETDRGPLALCDGVEPERAITDCEMRGTVREAVARLPEPLKSIIIRTQWRGDRLIDIAQDMNVSFQRVAQYKEEAICALSAWLSMIDEDVPAPPDGSPGIGRRVAYCDQMWRSSTWRSRLDQGALAVAEI